jgi:RHS repeat-associated protein
LNLQGDVVKLINASGTTIANYAYSAFGEILSITDEDGAAITSSTHVANINPLRYRGYYYDTETGFYYLQSRYYDPVIGRFINAESYASTGQSFTGYNMFAYCNSNPINLVDQAGSKPNHPVMVSDGGGGNGGYTPVDRTRDVSAEVDAALEEAIDNIGYQFWWSGTASVLSYLTGNIEGLYDLSNYGIHYVEFYHLVKKDAAWDIKYYKSWEKTIGTPFPGQGVPVLYHGMKMTPEQLGNYTYGYLGAAYGFGLPILITGSEYAAGNPTSGDALEHELEDQKYVTLGYNAYP